MKKEVGSSMFRNRFQARVKLEQQTPQDLSMRDTGPARHSQDKGRIELFNDSRGGRKEKI